MNDFTQWANEAPPHSNPTTQVFNTGTVEGGEKVVITMKAGPGFEAPWIVFHASSNAEAADLMGAAEATGLLALVAQTDKALKAQFMVGRELGGTPVQSPAAAEQQWQQQAQPQQGYQQQPQGQPQQYQQAAGQPPGPAPTCPHGTKVFKPAGVSNSGKNYGATWNCPLKVANYRDPNGCQTQWINNR